MATTLSTSSRQSLQGVASRSTVLAKMSTSQTTNVSAGDHLKFDTVALLNGSDISLDTTTTYSSTTGAASIGRFTLKAGKTYRLIGDVAFTTATNSAATLAWYNASSNTQLPGEVADRYPSSTGSTQSSSSSAVSVFTPTTDTLVEFRITSVSSVTNFKIGSALIETTEQVVPVRQAATGVAYLKDVKTNGTAAQTITAGSWNVRVLNTLNADPGTTWISLSSNQFTLQPGTYRIEAAVPGLSVGVHRARLRNVTASSTEIAGLGADCNSNVNVSVNSIINGTFTITSATTYQIEQNSVNTNNGGVASGGNITNDTEVEVYTTVTIEKVG